MILSKRERYAAVAAVVVVAALVIDQFVVSPLMAQQKKIDSEISKTLDELGKNHRLINERPKNSRTWKAMVEGGLRFDASAAETQALHSILNWPGITSLQRQRVETEKQYQKMTFAVTGAGSMESITKFLYRLETSGLPVHVSDLQINTRKDGADDLTVQMTISTIFIAPESPKGQSPVASAREDNR